MAVKWRVEVHPAPALVPRERLRGSLVVVIDVLRASTTIVHALAAGCQDVLPAGTVEDARRLADGYPPQQCLLTGERNGVCIDGFQLGNSPGEFTSKVCAGRHVISTTTNGTGAILHATQAERVLIGAFVNYSAICEELVSAHLPIHLLCAGTAGRLALEDMLFAGAVVDFLAERGQTALDDAARVAWDAHEHHGKVLIAALALSAGGRLLLDLGFDTDLKAAANVDRFGLIPEVQLNPVRVVPANVHLGSNHFRGNTGLV